jgi:uncharacterized protein YfeS
VALKTKWAVVLLVVSVVLPQAKFTGKVLRRRRDLGLRYRLRWRYLYRLLWCALG